MHRCSAGSLRRHCRRSPSCSCADPRTLDANVRAGAAFGAESRRAGGRIGRDRRLLHRVLLGADRSSTRAFACRRISPRSTPTCATRHTPARSRSSTSATAPTPCRPGRWRNRSAISRTTARSTPSRATALWMAARTPAARVCRTAPIAEELQPVVSLTGSDSLSLDNVVELLYHGGRSLPHALMMLVPEPWEQLPDMDPARRAFYDFHAGLIEQWDGPAALAFSDGVIAGATLDRNGLRPLRYAITERRPAHRRLGGRHGRGRPGDVIEKGRLGPGQMIVVDTAAASSCATTEIKARDRRPSAVRGLARTARGQRSTASESTPARPRRRSRI